MPEPILIVSHARSGSTLLRYILDTHPDVCAPAESPLGSLCAMVTEFGKQLPGEDGRPGGAAADAFIAGARELIDTTMSAHAARRGKTTWCVKSLSVADQLTSVSRVFPKARYLCLYRHAMDVVASSVNASRWGYGSFGFRPYILERPENTVAALTQSWIDRTTAMADLEREAAVSTFRVRYEDLVTKPDHTITQILRYLGLRRSPRIVAAMVSGALHTSHDRGYGDYKVDFTAEVNTDSIGRGHIVPVASIEDGQLPVMNGLLSDLDYALVDKQWNTRPSTGPARAGLAEQVARAMTEVIEPRLARRRDGGPAIALRLDIGYPDGRVEHWRADPAQGTLTPDPEPDNNMAGYRLRAESLLELASGTIDFGHAVGCGVVRRGRRDQGRDSERLAGQLFNGGSVPAAMSPAWSD
jgi:hypothetical protein